MNARLITHEDNPDSGVLGGCARVWDLDGPDVIVQFYDDPNGALAAAVAPCYAPAGERFGRMPKAVLLEAARALLGGER